MWNPWSFATETNLVPVLSTGRRHFGMIEGLQWISLLQSKSSGHCACAAISSSSKLRKGLKLSIVEV